MQPQHNNNNQQSTIDRMLQTAAASQRAQVHVFQTKLSLLLAAVTLVGFAVLSLVFGGDDHAEPVRIVKEDSHHWSTAARWLEEEDDGDSSSSSSSYAQYSCNHLYSVTPDRGDEQCQFAKECNQGAGVWAPFVFCQSHFNVWMAILSPVILIWMILLFRLLGSTAEDYFSPSLEMFSVQLGLPPRFAGVTLLALGNGAADVSATVSAISNDPQHGYLLSLGALTGAAMFITSVIAAAVVLVAGGVPCRGALVRDVAALGISVLIVWYQLGGSNPQGGIVGPDQVTLFLSLYAVFVLLVLCADVYHRAVVLPRQTLRAQEQERQRQLREQELHEQQVGTQQLDAPEGGGQETLLQQPQGDATASSHRNPVRFSTVLTAFSNYDNEGTNEGWGLGSNNNSNNNNNNSTDALGVDSQELAQDRPIMLHGAHGILNTPQHHTPGVHPPENDAAAVPEETAYAMLEDAGIAMDRTCVDEQSLGVAPHSWHQAWTTNVKEVTKHSQEVWDDIFYNGDLDVVTKALLILEIPFLVVRKVTVPIPCDGYYVRGIVVLSMAVSPLWMGLYLWNSMDIFVWKSSIFWVYWGICLFVALALMRFAPGGSGSLTLWVSTPVALYGFVMAATWIDTVADALVSLLDFLGIVMRIPGPIVGLTILAWGNSMADLSADITMARKGLANMAMTACFAGPFFNILVGLGLGFSNLSAQTGEVEHAVKLQPSISAGFWFLALNSVIILATGLCLGGGRIPKKYGYIAMTLYTIYLIVSITLQYTRSEDEEL